MSNHFCFLMKMVSAIDMWHFRLIGQPGVFLPQPPHHLASARAGQPVHRADPSTALRTQAIGGKERRYMKEKIKYTDEPIGKVRVISDFLPSPQELALKDETVKVTIALSKTSVEFFKKEAKKYNTQYQKMIRRLLDEYAAHQS